LEERDTKFSLNKLNIHRLVLTSVMIASKFMDDKYYSNQYWSRVGGITNDELNSLEIEFLFLLDFHLHIRRSEFNQLISHLKKIHDAPEISDFPIETLPMMDSVRMINVSGWVLVPRRTDTLFKHRRIFKIYFFMWGLTMSSLKGLNVLSTHQNRPQNSRRISQPWSRFLWILWTEAAHLSYVPSNDNCLADFKFKSSVSFKAAVFTAQRLLYLHFVSRRRIVTTSSKILLLREIADFSSSHYIDLKVSLFLHPFIVLIWDQSNCSNATIPLAGRALKNFRHLWAQISLFPKRTH